MPTPGPPPSPTNGELRARYGPDVPITRRRGFALVHLDRPSEERIGSRTRDFDPDDYFEPDCPLCAIQRSRRVVVFDDVHDGTEEEIVIDDG